MEQFNCVSCGCKIKPSYGGGVTYENVNRQGFVSGMANTISAGYGSSFDCDSFIVAICDVCIPQLISSGRLYKDEPRYIIPPTEMTLPELPDMEFGNEPQEETS